MYFGFSLKTLKKIKKQVRFIWQTTDTYNADIFSLLFSSLPRGDKWTCVRCDSFHPKAATYKSTNEKLLWSTYFSSLTEEAKGDWQGKETSAFHLQSKTVFAATYTGTQFTHNGYLESQLVLQNELLLQNEFLLLLWYIWG